ncbi:MAG TPA: type II toxin-antitoxin system death-on-curing family toxin [Candidatus Saccharimonadales bacterium]|nr:type II toxin-antitoxin system death-on-curing family toxin [Candidatus Saccharimonadales bacterium]
MKIRQLDLADAEFIAHALALRLMDSDSEPIPPFHTRHAGKLESCLAEPFQTFDGKFLHRTFAERAAKLFYLITKNHCFENGNKRMAVTLTLVFFYTNKRWIHATPEELYLIACKVAESKPQDKDIVHELLTETFRKFTTPLPQGRK